MPSRNLGKGLVVREGLSKKVTFEVRSAEGEGGELGEGCLRQRAQPM